MVFDDEINEIGEKLNIDKIKTNLVNNIIHKPEQNGGPSRRNAHFMRPRYVPTGRTTNFSFEFILKKTTTFEEVGLTPINKTGYILNFDGTHNREGIFENWKRGMNSVLNLNTTWTAGNLLNYIEHIFSITIVDWYDSLDEDGKNVLRTMETPVCYVQKIMQGH